MWTRSTGVDQNLFAPSYLPKQFPATLLDITSKYLKTVLRRPHQVTSIAPVRMQAALVISHLQCLTYAGYAFPKGDGFADPLSGTRDQAGAGGRPYQKHQESKRK